MNIPLMEYYREQKGLSYEQLSEVSGIPLPAIQKIFGGEILSPEYTTLQRLEQVLKPREDSPGIMEELRRYDAVEREYTLDDYYALPDDQRVELIDGVFYDMAAPSLGHQRICTKLGYMLEDSIMRREGDCIVFASPVDVQLDCDESTMVQPDLVIVCDKEKLTGRCIAGAPDFVLEILSDSTRQKDMFLKLTKYRSAGVREYWMVDLDKKRIIAYFFEADEMPVIYGSDDKVPVQIFDGELEIDFSQVTKP